MKLLNKQSNILFAILSGILLAASFPPLPFPLLSFVAFVPLLFILIRNENLRFKYLLIYLTFFIYHTSSNWWISSWAKETDPFLLISGLGLDIIHPLFFLFPFWLSDQNKQHRQMARLLKSLLQLKKNKIPKPTPQHSFPCLLTPILLIK